MRLSARWWLAGAVLLQAYGWVPVASAERIRVERPSVDRHQFRQHRGGGNQHRFQRSGEGRVAKGKICINCEGPNSNPNGPKPCGVGPCGHGPNNRRHDIYVRLAQGVGRDAARDTFRGKSIPVTATKSEKRDYMRDLRRSANRRIRSAMEREDVRPAYRPYGIEAGKQTIGRQAAKLIRAWKQDRREAGLGKPANITARNGRF